MTIPAMAPPDNEEEELPPPEGGTAAETEEGAEGLEVRLLAETGAEVTAPVESCAGADEPPVGAVVSPYILAMFNISLAASEYP